MGPGSGGSMSGSGSCYTKKGSSGSRLGGVVNAGEISSGNRKGSIWSGGGQ